MQFVAYLTFDGQCEAAFRYYEQVLPGKIELMLPHGATPSAEHVPAEWLPRIMHARLSVGSAVLMGSDGSPAGYHQPQGISVALQIDSVAEAERIYAALSAGGTVHMPLGPTFWAARFGAFTDRFGIPWMINCEGKSESV